MVRNNFNTEVVFDAASVTKTTYRAFPIESAQRLVDQTYRYCEALDQEPLAIPRLHLAELVPADTDTARIRITTDRNYDPNLQTTPKDVVARPLASTLEKIASMTTLGLSGRLAVPIDAAGPNFHVSTGGAVTLVDVFPPLIRRANGDMPLEDIQFSRLPLRRQHIEYYRGTRVGAIMRTLITVSSGYSPAEQAVGMLKHREWCHDVVPVALPVREREVVHRAIDTRFCKNIVIGGISDALCLVALKMDARP